MTEQAGNTINRGRTALRRAGTVAGAVTVMLALAATPSFADTHVGYNASCPSGRTVVTHSHGKGNAHHEATKAGVLRPKDWTGLDLGTYYHNYFGTGWQSVDSWAVQTAGAMDQWSADCVS